MHDLLHQICIYTLSCVLCTDVLHRINRTEKNEKSKRKLESIFFSLNGMYLITNLERKTNDDNNNKLLAKIG